MADGPYLDNMRIAISRQQFDGSSTKFTMMMHNDRHNPNGPSEMLFAGQAPKNQYISCGCTLAPPGECDRTVRVRRRCGLLSN